MDGWAIAIFVGSIILYFVSKKHPFFILTTGIGIGFFFGGIWGVALVTRMLR